VSSLPVLSYFYENGRWKVFVYHIVPGIIVKLINIPRQEKGIQAQHNSKKDHKRQAFLHILQVEQERTQTNLSKE